MPQTFGKRIVGAQAAAEAVKNQQGGTEVFGKRVRASLPSTATASGEDAARANSEFGVRTLEGAHFQDHEGNPSSGLSVEALQEVLTNNPTFFDSLYEAELGRSAGPRKAALRVFAVVEDGIRGQGRPHVLQQINNLLGKTQVDAQREAQRVGLSARRLEQQQERTKLNVQLQGADRAESLAGMLENLDKIKKFGDSAGVDDLVESTSPRSGVVASMLQPPSTEAQIAAMAEEEGGEGEGGLGAGQREPGQRDEAGARSLQDESDEADDEAETEGGEGGGSRSTGEGDSTDAGARHAGSTASRKASKSKKK